MNQKVLRVTETTNLISTCDYPYAKFPFDKFNPVQSSIFDIYNKDANFIIAASTSAGKTITAEMIMAYGIRELGGKALYLAPLRALAQERSDDWKSNHHFADQKLSILTGDYRLTESRRKELDESNIIIMTSEMLNSRARNYKSENNAFLKTINTLVVDESHLIGVLGRGDHLESGIMKFTEVNPDCRLVFLSATMPNVGEIGEWLSELNGRITYVLESNYRPCKLNIHHVKYWDKPFSYEDNEREKIEEAIRIYNHHSNDKFIMFVHTKRTGDMLASSLKQLGIQCEYHNADLNKEKRIDIEKRFREDPKLRVVVATSGLAQGLNMPARRVVIVGVHRGINEVEPHDIHQMCVQSDSRIMLHGSENLYKSAKDICIGDIVAGIDDNNKIRGGKVRNIFTRKARVNSIVMSNGTKLNASSHPILMWDGAWKNSDELIVGDKVCITTVANQTCDRSIKDIFLDAAKCYNGYCRLLENEKEAIPLHEFKDSYKFRKTGIVKAHTAVKYGIQPVILRSKNGSEIDIRKIQYEDFSWLLGILATDGNIKNTKTNTCLRLKCKDKRIVEKFSNILLAGGLHAPLKLDKRNFWSCECSSHPLVKIVSHLGITQNKTRTLDVDFILNCQKRDKVQFLAGVIDGDGNFGKSIRICTASKIFARQLKDLLISLDIRASTKFYEGAGHVFDYICDTGHYIISISNKEDINKLITQCRFSVKLPSDCLVTLKASRPKNGDLFYTRVESIEYGQECEVINFSVEDSNTFIVEDVVTHNCGRAGRPQYDPQGDAYILLPNRSYKKCIQKLEEQQEIKSQMLDGKTLAFHLTSEIHHGNIQSLNDVTDWYERSLAHHQDVTLEEDVAKEVVKNLTRCGAVREEDNCYDVTTVGTVSSMFYYSPFDVSDLNRNFTRVFDREKESNDHWLAMALGFIDSNKKNIASNAEREEVEKFVKGLNETNCEDVLAGSRGFLGPNGEGYGVVKMGACYYNLLRGYNSTALNTTMRGLQLDSERLCEVLSAMDQMTGKWDQRDFFKRLYLRLLYGVDEKMVPLCKLKGIGKIKAKRLWDANLRDLESIGSNVLGVIKALNCSKNVAEEICKNAKEIMLSEP